MRVATFSALALFSLPPMLLGGASPLTDAYRDGAMSRVVYRVVDDRGTAVSNATARICYKSYGRPQDNAEWETCTDRDGKFVAEHRTNERLKVFVRKDGHYGARDEISYFDMKRNSVSDGKWLPYGDTKTLVLKRILNPTEMNSSAGLDYHKYPPFGKWAGFDLQRRSWTPPWGEGCHPDMLVRFEWQNTENGYHRTMKVSFTNNPFAGVYQLKADDSSEMDSVYCADTNATYLSSLLFTVDRDANGFRRHDLEEDQYLVFRTRTATNETGRLVSAHYGKIYGNWRFGERGGMAIQRIEFNPTPNDTNLESSRRPLP